MKTTQKILAAFVIACSLTATALASSAQTERVVYNASVRQKAVQIARQGKVEESLAYIETNIKSEETAQARSIETAQQLINVSWVLFNERRMALAKSMANKALIKTQQLIQDKTQTSNMADLLNSMGLGCELILSDLDAAQSYYTAALAMKPGNAQITERMNMVAQKIKARKR